MINPTKNNGLIKALFLIAVCLFSSCGGSAAKKKKKDKPSIPSFYETVYAQENLAMTIELDVDQLLSDKSGDENNYQDAQVTAYNGSEELFTGTISIRPRGITRRANCDFPPIMLKVRKKQRDSLAVGKSDNVKLVTYCKDSVGYSDWVLREYLAYKLYNEVSDHSFRAKLVDITYTDIQGRHEDITKTGFMIEPLDEMADRLGCKVVPDEQAIKTIHKDKYKALTLFQYMVGNSDWNFSKRHNVRLLDCGGTTGPIPVPYDFDYSGLVNAAYAKPHPMLPIEKVTDRIFQWRGSVQEDFSATMQLLQAKKQAFEMVVNNLTILEDQQKNDVLAYLDAYYTSITSSSDIQKAIEKAR